ncbi:MAG: TonB-dependent receptor [Burkholderiaceae bacterium]|nr:TonB-dependent receptor [Burkholderiaceae bacterium]
MFKRTKVSVGVLLALGGAVVATSMPAVAQDAVQRIEITGSSIKRLAIEGALPVQTITQEDIQRSGVTSVTDLIQSLPVMQGFTSIGDSVGGGGGGVTTASIHDVGEQYTLVLLNGRRVAPATSGTTIDLNSIPLAAIERVEVLTDGASAIYGADAIAGVVNFILKQGEAPLTLDARISMPEAGGGEQANFAISKGFGDVGKDGYSVFLAASFDKQRQLKSTDRDFASTGILSGTFGDLAYDFFNGSSRSVPPNVDVRGTAIGGVRANGSTINSISFNPYLEANGECPADHVVLGRQCWFDYTTTVEIAPERERMALYGSGELQLGSSGFTGFADFAYTDVSTVPRIAPYPAEFSLPLGSDLYDSYVLPYLTPEQAAVASSVNVKYRLFDMGSRTYDYATKSLHTVLGAEGAVGDWDIAGGVTFSMQRQDQDYLAGFPLAAPFTEALTTGAVDPFPYTAGTMPADQLAALLATQYVGNYNKTDIKMVGLDGNAQRPLFSMPGGDAILSMGFDFRKTGYQVTANGAVANAEILFDDPQPEYDLSRSGWGAYGEMLFPVSKAIELTAALRHDQMSGVTDKQISQKFGDTESATTFKLGGKWEATPSLLMRASVGSGFRTASMLEIAQPKVDFGVTSGTYDCPFSASYDPLGYFAAGHICEDGLQYEVFTGGNPELKPEKSTQWNLGAVWQPTDALSIGLNYWSVSIKDAVTSVSESQILNNAADYLDLFTTKYKASNDLTYVAILLAPTNIGKLENEGIDWDFTYKGKTNFGRFEGMLAGTYLVKSRYTLPGTDDQWTTSLGQFGINDAVSFRNVITARGTVGIGAWEHTLTMKYRSGYADQFYSAEDWCFFYDPNTNECADGRLQVPEYMTFDWQTKWQATRNLGVTFAIENLFDEDPPLSLRVNGAGHQLGYDPRYASPYGRTFVLQAKYQF